MASKPPVTDDAQGHTAGREEAAQDERRYRALPGRAQQRVGDERAGDVEHSDHGQGLEAVTFAGRGSETLAFTRKEIEGATEELLNDNGIRSQGSPELMTVWNAKPRK